MELTLAMEVYTPVPFLSHTMQQNAAKHEGSGHGGQRRRNSQAILATRATAPPLRGRPPAAPTPPRSRPEPRVPAALRVGEGQLLPQAAARQPPRLARLA